MKYKIKPNLAFRKISDEYYIVDSRNSMLHKLNSVGSLIWEVLKKGATVKEIVELVYKEYEVEIETLTKDVEEFITELKNKSLIEEYE